VRVGVTGADGLLGSTLVVFVGVALLALYTGYQAIGLM
jgi:hypothetical protein